MGVSSAIAPLIAVPLGFCIGWLIHRHGRYGGWGWRHTHSCGWFDPHPCIYDERYGTGPCPNCGRVDRQWKARMGRPTFPWGWEWRNG